MNMDLHKIFFVRPTGVAKVLLIGFCLALFLSCVQEESGQPSVSAHTPLPTQVAEGVQVSLDYTLTLSNQQVYETTAGKKPLVFVYGDGQVVPGLELALEGMKVGEQKHIVVPPAQGYGELTLSEVSEIPKELIAPDARKVGAQLQGLPRHGQQILMHVKEVKEDTVVVDFNHPLAGKTLYFDIRVMDLQTRTAS